MLEDTGKVRKFRNTLSFEGTRLKNYPLFMFNKKLFEVMLSMTTMDYKNRKNVFYNVRHIITNGIFFNVLNFV
jgi:hypothetical protein